jgi:hypothetical protein
MGIILKFIAVLLILAAIGVTGYAYLGDLSPDQGSVTEPVMLDAQ